VINKLAPVNLFSFHLLGTIPFSGNRASFSFFFFFPKKTLKNLGMLQRIQQYRIQDLAPCHADHTGSREVRVGRVLNSCAVPDEADCEAYWQSLPHSSACGSLTPVPTEPGQLFPAHLASKGLLALASRTAGTVAFTEPSGSSMLEAAEVVQASMLPLHAQIWWLFVGGLPNASRRQGVSQQVPCNKRMSSD